MRTEATLPSCDPELASSLMSRSPWSLTALASSASAILVLVVWAFPLASWRLYTGCAGIRPEGTLPLTVDLGYRQQGSHAKIPLYMGSRREKVSADEEREFLDELMAALKERWPDIVIQFEDWKNPFPSLDRYRHDYAMFNDDIQGTGAVIMGGIIGAIKQSGLRSPIPSCRLPRQLAPPALASPNK